jgi:hypothetical protein
LRTLRALFDTPDLLKPQRTTAQVTTALAEEFAKVARSLQKRESAELADAKTRAEVNTSPSGKTSALPGSSIASSSVSSPRTPACCPKSSFQTLPGPPSTIRTSSPRQMSPDYG